LEARLHRLSDSGKGMTDLQKQEMAAAIAAQSGDALARYAQDSGIAFTITTNALSGRAA